jgi:hypothetical protein
MEMHLTCERKRTEKDEGDLIEQIFNCDLARNQAGSLQWHEIHDRLVELKIYKNRDSARPRVQKLLKAGWLDIVKDRYWPAQP